MTHDLANDDKQACIQYKKFLSNVKKYKLEEHLKKMSISLTLCEYNVACFPGFFPVRWDWGRVLAIGKIA